jgi:hypothetical protein
MFLPARPDRDWTLDWALRRNRDHRTGAGMLTNHPDGTPPGELLWHASPDIRVRPAPGAPHPAPASLPWTNANRPTDRFQLWTIQTALHAIDQRVVPDGRWTVWWQRRLRAIRTDPARGLSNQVRVDAALWNHASIQAGFWSDPWAPGGPTEADLVDRIVGMATPRTGGVTARARQAASVALPAGPARVEVCVHRRGLDPARAGEVAVLLVLRPLPTGTPPAAGPHGWAGLPAFAVPAGGDLEAAMHAVGAGGGQLPGGFPLPADWLAADAATAIRRPGRDARSADAAVLTFQVDFTGRAGTWLLLALVHHGNGTPILGGADLRDQVRRSPHVAARSVQVV